MDVPTTSRNRTSGGGSRPRTEEEAELAAMAAAGAGPFGVNQAEKWRAIGAWAAQDSVSAALEDSSSGPGVGDSADSEALEAELRAAKASLVRRQRFASCSCGVCGCSVLHVHLPKLHAFFCHQSM